MYMIQSQAQRRSGVSSSRAHDPIPWHIGRGNAPFGDPVCLLPAHPLKNLHVEIAVTAVKKRARASRTMTDKESIVGKDVDLYKRGTAIVWTCNVR